MSSCLFALLVLCFLVYSSQASPVYKKLVEVEEYRLHIHESGEDFNETLRIDEEEQTELFKVPAHRNIEKSDIMFDFKMNATMIHFPLKGLCFLLPLTRSQPTPRNLATNLHQVSSEEVTTHKETVRIGKEITDRSILSDSTARLCSKSRIFRVTEIPSEVDVTKMNPPAIRRARRQSYVYELCDDGLDLQQAATTCPFQFIPKCKVEYLSCAWLVNCQGLMGMAFRKRVSADNYIAASRAGLRTNIHNGGSRKVTCLPTHLQYSIVCCGYYCDT